MKKTKKIQSIPKYRSGGLFSSIKIDDEIKNKLQDKESKQKVEKLYKQGAVGAYGVGEGLLDTVTMGATDKLTDKGYSTLQNMGNATEDEKREQDSIRGFGNAAGAVGGAFINPAATGAAINQAGKGLGAGISKGNESKDWAQTAGMALTTAGKVGSMAYGMSGSPMTPGMESQAGNFNSSSFGQGLGKYNEFMGQNNMTGMPNMMDGDYKYGGYMKYAMGGMQYANGGTGEISGEVEGAGFDENGNPKNGENAVGPNGEFTQFKGATHAQGGIKTDMAPGTRIFSDKLKAPGTNKTFAKLNAGNNTNREDKLDTKEYLDPKSKMSIDLTRMAKMKNSDMLFAMQEQLKKDKVAAYAKRMGVELPSMDNEQMEPQGMPEQAEGEMVMARYGGMMNKMAMGGVQLPYYNMNNNGTPKYAMGGIENTPSFVPTPTPLPEFNNRSDFEKHYQAKGYAKDPRNRSGMNAAFYDTQKYLYDAPSDTFKFSNNEPVPYNSLPSSDLIQFTPKAKAPVAPRWISTGTMKDGRHERTYLDGHKEIVGEVTKPTFAYGGKLPKYSLAGTVSPPEDGYIDPSETAMLEARDSAKYYENLANQNTMVDPYRYKSIMTPSNVHDDPNAAARRDDRLLREATELKKANEASTDTGNNSFNWKDSLEKVGNFAAQNAGNIYNLSRYNKPEIETYERAQAKYLDPTQARKDEQYNYRQSLENVRTGSMGSGATLLANTNAARNRTSANIGRINKEYENANSQIGNQVNQFNTEMAYRETLANAQNRARNRSGKGEAIGDIGEKFGMATKANKQGNMDQNTLDLMMKYYNTPEFQKIMKDNKFKK